MTMLYIKTATIPSDGEGQQQKNVVCGYGLGIGYSG